jgi:hypothetical protein
LDAAAGIEHTRNPGPAGFRGIDKIFQYPVSHVFMEYTDISIKDRVHLEGLQFDAIQVRGIFDSDIREIRQPSLRADACEFGIAIVTAYSLSGY